MYFQRRNRYNRQKEQWFISLPKKICESQLLYRLSICLYAFMILNFLFLFFYFHSSSQQQTSIPTNSNNQIQLNDFKTFHDDYHQPIEDISRTMSDLIKRIFKNSIPHLNANKTNHFISLFEFQLISINYCNTVTISTKYYGCWLIENTYNDKILIKGTKVSLIISGFNFYLNDYLHSSLSWNGNNLMTIFNTIKSNNNKLPNILTNKQYGHRIYKYTYYKNPCTDSYTMAFWDWDRWEKEIDWMSLNGINLLLLPTINEYIEYLLYTKYYNLNDNDLINYFVGPAFFAWFRMGFVIYILIYYFIESQIH